MNASELDYELPPELIAQHPAARRDESRLLVYDRATGEVRHRVFRDLPASSARDARRRQRHAGRPGADPRSSGRGARCCCSSGSTATSGRGSRGRPGGCGRGGATGRSSCSSISARGAGGCGSHGEPAGETPLPPYITEPLADPERYQTVYAREPGSAAAPTAGLHFTPELLARLDVERVTLHVGLDTFRPLAVERSRSTRCTASATRFGPRRGSGSARRERVLAVGTTTVRVLETLARGAPLAGRTELFVMPGLRVPAGRRAAHELPPAALDPARARDGVRRRRADAGALPGRR